MKTKDNWQRHGACRDESPELFFPVGTTGPALLQEAEAQAVCRRCPVIDWCGQWALDNHIEDGVWGGMTEADRKSLRRRTNRQAAAQRATRQLAECGTEAAYRRHRKNKEAVDFACREARRLAQADRAAAEKTEAIA